MNQTLSPNVFSLGGTPIAYLGCNTSSNAASWNVTGNVMSNSTIFTRPSNSGPIMVPDTSGNSGSIWAKYGCAGTGFSCSSTAPTTAQQSDPNYSAPDISGPHGAERAVRIAVQHGRTTSYLQPRASTRTPPR